MKKKKILLGLALAAAAVFSLASCGDDDNTPADSGQSQVTPDNGGSQGGNNSQGGNQGGNTQTQKYAVTYHTAHGTAPAAVANVTALPATLPTLEDEEYDFLGWTATENGTELVTAGAAITKNTDLYAVWQVKAKYSITYHTTIGTAPDAVADVRKLPDTLPTLEDEDNNFLGWTATENGTELVTAGTAISANTDLYAVWAEKDKYTVTYHTAHGTAPDNLANIRKLPDTLPTLTDVEYNFVGWTATENGTELVTAGAAISANTDLYAVWAEKAAYDKFVSVASNNQTLILNETFEDSTSVVTFERIEDLDNVAVFNRPSQKGSPKAGSKYDLEVSDGKAVATDNDATVNAEDSNNNGKTQAVISFGADNVYKKVEGYVDVTLASAAGSWTFMQFVGTDNQKDGNEVFGLRTVSVKANNKTTVYIKYRIDGGSSEIDPENSIVLTENSTYGILYSVDLMNSKITIKIVTKDKTTGVETVTNFVTDKVVEGLMHVEYLNIQSSDKNSNLFSIDNVAVSGTEFELSEYKEFLLAAYTPRLTEMAAEYTTNATAYATWKDKIIDAIQNAASIEAIDDILDPTSEIMLELYAIKTDLQIAMEAAISEIDTKYGVVKSDNLTTVPNYSINLVDFLTAYGNAMQSFSNCKTAAEVTTAKNNAIIALDAIEDDAAAKADYISALVDYVKAAFDPENYTYTDTDYNNKTDYDNAIASITGDHKGDIDESYTNALITISGIDSNAGLLSKAKTDYKASVNSYRTDLSGQTVDSADQANIYAYYTETEFSTKVSDAQTAIDAETVTTIAAVKNIYASFTESVDTDVNSFIMSIEDLTTQLNSTLATKKDAAKEKFESNTFDGYVDEITALVATDYSTKDDLKNAYNAKLARLDYLDEWYDSVVATVDEYRQYAYNEREEKCLDKTINYLTLIDNLKAYFNTRYTDLLAIEYGTDTYEATIEAFIAETKAGADDIIADYRANTEVTVSFVKKASDTDAFVQTTIVKNSKVTVPNTEPTLDGFAFAGWDFDFDTPISSNTTIVAKWHDLYVATETKVVKTTASTPTTGKIYDTDGISVTLSGTVTLTQKEVTSKDGKYTFTHALLPGGGNRTYTFRSSTAQTIIVYYTITDASWSDQNKQLTVNGTNVTSYTSEKKCPGSTPVAYELTLPANTDVVLGSSGSRLVIWGYEYVLNTSTEITGMTANLSYDGSSIIASDVKLIPAGETDPTKYIAITTGYNVSLIDELGQVAANNDLDEGDEYTVIVKYGSYTEFKSSYTI